MAVIKPFKGMTYNPDTVGDLSSVVAPHCHAEEDSTIGDFYSAHPFNVVRLEYPAGYGDKYQKTADTLKNWLDTDILSISPVPSIYIYEQEYTHLGVSTSYKGLICKVKIDVDTVVPHERTNSELYDAYKSHRYNLMMATASSFCSVYSLYKDDENEVSLCLETKSDPDMEFTDKFDVTHRVWTITDENKINELQNIFENKKLIIADGHVRYSTASRYREKMKNSVVEYSGEEDFNYIMMNLMPLTPDKPTILPVHRLIKNRQNLAEETVLEKISQNFTFEKSYIREYDCEKIEKRLKDNKEKRVLGFYTGKDYYYILTPKENVTAKTDADMLHAYILDGVFGINKDNLKTYVDYGYTLRDSEQAIREHKADFAFYLNPMSTQELYTFTENGERTPKRSNYFYPKLMLGIVMDKFED